MKATTLLDYKRRMLRVLVHIQQQLDDPLNLDELARLANVSPYHFHPYDTESDTIATMTAFAESRGLSPHGLHHEIYLSDPRRVPPERLKTILRLPVTGA